jgi:hypothetical protein
MMPLPKTKTCMSLSQSLEVCKVVNFRVESEINVAEFIEMPENKLLNQ